MTEPLGQSQVIPYVLGLARAGFSMTIVSLEPEDTPPEATENVRARLEEAGIRYVPGRRRRSHRFTIKLQEATRELASAIRVAASDRPRIVHARSYFAATIADVIAHLTPKAQLLFDVRGLLGEEYIDAGHWTARTPQYRLLKIVERRLFADASGVVVLTARHREHLRSIGLLRDEVPSEVIPCCVDTKRFDEGRQRRDEWRALLDARERFVLVYGGTLGSWYMENEMALLFAAIRRRVPALFAVYTKAPSDRLRRALAAAGVSDRDVVIRSVAPAEMPAALSAGDAAVSLIRPCFSKLGSSPTKIAEYLAVGLPVLANRGVGDLDGIIDGGPPFVDCGTAAIDELELAADRVLSLDSKAVARGAQDLAAREFDVDVGITRYRRLYERLVRNARSDARASSAVRSA